MHIFLQMQNYGFVLWRIDTYMSSFYFGQKSTIPDHLTLHTGQWNNRLGVALFFGPIHTIEVHSLYLYVEKNHFARPGRTLQSLYVFIHLCLLCLRHE